MAGGVTRWVRSIVSSCKVRFATAAGLYAVKGNEQLWVRALPCLPPSLLIAPAPAAPLPQREGWV